MHLTIQQINYAEKIIYYVNSYAFIFNEYDNEQG